MSFQTSQRMSRTALGDRKTRIGRGTWSDRPHFVSSLEYSRSGTCPGRDGPRDPISKPANAKQSAIEPHPVDRRERELGACLCRDGQRGPTGGRPPSTRMAPISGQAGPGSDATRRIGPGSPDGPAAPRCQHPITGQTPSRSRKTNHDSNQTIMIVVLPPSWILHHRRDISRGG